MAETADHWRKWEQTRRIGRRRFVWRYGVCGFGLSTGVLMSAASWFLVTPHPPLWFLLSVAQLLLFPVGGYYWGVLFWWWMELQYRAARRSNRGYPDVEAGLDGPVEELPVADPDAPHEKPL